MRIKYMKKKVKNQEKSIKNNGLQNGLEILPFFKYCLYIQISCSLIKKSILNLKFRGKGHLNAKYQQNKHALKKT